MYVFQTESTLYSCLNVKELLAQSRHKIWSLSDCNWTQTQNHLVCKRTLNHLAKPHSSGFKSSWYCTVVWRWCKIQTSFKMLVLKKQEYVCWKKKKQRNYKFLLKIIYNSVIKYNRKHSSRQEKVFYNCYIWRFVCQYFSDSKKTCTYFGLDVPSLYF